MFGFKKVNKANRFQAHVFRKRLKSAREYRRTPHKPNKNPITKTINKLGLKSTKAKTLFLAILILFVYLAYAPNFLSLNNIKVEGLSETENTQALNTLNGYFTSRQLLAQKNFFFFSKKRATDFLEKNNFYILGVESIEKKFPDQLIINLLPRYNKFLALVGDKTYVLTNDGIAVQKISEIENASSTLVNSLTKLEFLETPEVTLNKNLLMKEEALALTEVADGFNELRIKLDRLSLENVSSFDTTAYSDLQEKFYFDLTTNLEKKFQQLGLLLSGFSEFDKAKLEYIDMRFKDRGYVCFKDTACIQEPDQKPQSTSSEESIINKQNEE